jgi:hypothetical protein
VKYNPRNNLIYGQHHCGKGRNSREIIIARHRRGGHKPSNPKAQPWTGVGVGIYEYGAKMNEENRGCGFFFF